MFDKLIKKQIICGRSPFLGEPGILVSLLHLFLMCFLFAFYFKLYILMLCDLVFLIEKAFVYNGWNIDYVILNILFSRVIE